MKLIKLIFSGFILLSLSCSKLTEPKVYSSLTNTNAFQTRDDAIAAVNGVYARLKSPSGRSDSWMYYAGFQVIISDLTTDVGHSNSAGDVGLMSDCLWSSTNTYLGFSWQQQYKLISDANNALFYIPKIASLTDAEKAQFIGEVRFLRALAYIDLTDAFGPVILMTEKNVENPDYEAKLPTTTVEEINKVIIGDLENAAANLPINYMNNAIYPTNDVGRATKGAALTLLTKLYMREHEWQQALDLTKQVMDLNQYGLYPSYAGLFKEDNKWCIENIFSAMANSLVDGVEMMNHFGPVNNTVVTNRWGYFGVTWHFWNTFEANDDRKQMFFYNYIGTDGLNYVQQLPGQTTPPAGEAYLGDAPTKKYADPTGSKTYYDGHGFPILRYADVLLCRAEALNELNGPNSESIDLINQVKGRSHATLLKDASTFTKESLRDAILQERGWEFFFECKRRQDLIRMGKYQEVVNAYLTAVGKDPVINIATDKYFPYPQSQVDINPNLSNVGRR